MLNSFQHLGFESRCTLKFEGPLNAVKATLSVRGVPCLERIKTKVLKQVRDDNVWDLLKALAG
ncbi:hypothetical protein V513_02960 [Mesotoga sp. H07.pep.5.3]|nr:hypothetical protein V513_02960 [Mesotoga sp. H07.pep.5.3]